MGQMTTGDRVLTVLGVALTALVTFGVIDAGQSDAITALFNAGVAAVLALRVRPLGPASE